MWVSEEVNFEIFFSVFEVLLRMRARTKRKDVVKGGVCPYYYTTGCDERELCSVNGACGAGCHGVTAASCQEVLL